MINYLVICEYFVFLIFVVTQPFPHKLDVTEVQFVKRSTSGLDSKFSFL